MIKNYLFFIRGYLWKSCRDEQKSVAHLFERSTFINLYQPLSTFIIPKHRPPEIRLARFQFSKMDRHHRHVLKNRERANRQRSARQATVAPK